MAIEDIALNETLATKALLGGFEQDLRALLSEFVINEHSLGDLVEEYQLEQRMDSLHSNPVDFLFLGEALNLVNANLAMFPEEAQTDLKMLLHNPENEAKLHTIRKRDGHNRETLAVAEGDFEAIYQLLQPLKSALFSITSSRLRMIEGGSLSATLAEMFQQTPACLHNLPRKDFEATTLVGRKVEIDRLFEEMLNPYTPVISVIAPGGLGKTALALEVAWQLANSSREFELVLWHSAKTDYWTVDGVVHDETVETDIERAVAALGKVIDPLFEGGIDDFFKTIGDIPTLIVLDNFETFTGTDFLTLFRKFPRTSKIKILITSRNGIGSNESRFELKPLETKAAVALVMKLSAVNQVLQLKNLTEKSKIDLVNEYACKPLDLKWLVQSLASGKTLTQIKQSRDGLLEFCVRSVLESISKDAIAILGSIFVARKGLLLAELHLLMGSQLIEELTPSIQELLRTSLVSISLSPSDPDSEIISLTEVISAYFEKTNFFSNEYLANLRKRRFDLKDELASAERPNGSITNPWTIFKRSVEDEFAAALLNRALVLSRKDYERAMAVVSDARQARKGYFEVARVEAFICQKRDAARAEKLLEVALSETSTDVERALVSYHYADFLSYADEVNRAVELSKFAHDVLNEATTARQHGYFLVRSDAFEDGIDLLEFSVQNSSGKTRLVCLNSLAKAYERFAESSYKANHDYVTAMKYVNHGLGIVRQPQSLGFFDEKTLDLHLNLVTTGLWLSVSEFQKGNHDFKDSCLELFADPSQIVFSLRGVPETSRYRTKIPDLLQTLSSFDQAFEQVRSSLVSSLGSSGTLSSSATQKFGVVRNRVESNEYAFIVCPDGNQYYLLKANLVNGSDWPAVKNGTVVIFEPGFAAPGSEQRGRYPKALRVEVSLG